MSRYWIIYEYCYDNQGAIRSLADTPLYNTMQDAQLHADRLQVKHPSFKYGIDYVDLEIKVGA